MNKHRMLILFVIYLLLSAADVFACGCPGSPGETVNDAVKRSVERATTVFAGKVVGFEYRKGIPDERIQSLKKKHGKVIEYETLVVKFQVERWWKGEPPPEIFMITSVKKYSDGTGSSAGCDYSFKRDENYLVYADGKAGELRTDDCTRTQLSVGAEADLKILGAGNFPVSNGNPPISGAQKRGAAATIEAFYKFHLSRSGVFKESEIQAYRRWFTDDLNRLFQTELQREKQYLKKFPTNKPFFGDGFPFQPLDECARGEKSFRNAHTVGAAATKDNRATVEVKFSQPKECGGALIDVYKVELVNVKSRWLIDDWLYPDAKTLTDALRRAEY